MDEQKVNEKLFEAELRLEERRNALSALLLREEEEYAKGGFSKLNPGC